MAIAAGVEFSGTRVSLDGDGLLLRQYLVVADSWPLRPSVGSAVATVVPMHGVQDMQMPLAKSLCRYAVFAGGERAAFDMAISALQGLPDNEGLAIRVFEM